MKKRDIPTAKLPDHPSKANKRITGMSFVRDMGKGRFGADPRRQVQLLMVLAVPEDIKLPDGAQIVVEGDFNDDGTVYINLHQHLVVDTTANQEELRKSIPNLRIDQVLTCLKWRV